MTTPPRTVAILAGGLNHERDISLRSGRRIANALTDAGFHVKLLDVDSTLLHRLTAIEPDVIWPLIHGTTGEDGSLQELLDLIGIPVVGAPADGARLSFDKPVAAAVLAPFGVKHPDSTALPQALFREVGATAILDLVESRYGFPVVVKPAAGGSALGVSKVTDAVDLPGAMVDAFAYADNVLIQRHVEGTEVAVSIAETTLGEPFALPPVEIVADGPYDYDARYNAGRAEYFVPARLSQEDLEACVETALTVHRALGLRHLSRTDLILDAEGTPWFIDVNTAPGMTETSLYPQAAARYALDNGVDANDLIVKIIEAALEGSSTTED